MAEPEQEARLVITCADRPGIVAAVSGFLFSHGANITGLHEYSEGSRFFMRVVFTTDAQAAPDTTLRAAFQAAVGTPFGMSWEIADAARRKRIAILASKEDHALLELLWRHRHGELYADIAFVASNHIDHARAVAEFGIPFHHFPIPKDRPDAKLDVENALTRHLTSPAAPVELVVLARYMQVLTPEFVARFPHKIINIHHSFLPAFIGAKPYHQAHARGVKLIGATAHYVTTELDQGPIIEQDVTRVSHRHTAHDLIRIGRGIEREVLARAVTWHLEDRVIAHGNKTVVFT